MKQRTLDEIAREASEVPALVKVDVEGSELAVLEGAQLTLVASAPPIFVLEVNYETSGAVGHRPVDLVARLPASKGYEVYRITPDGLAVEVDVESAPHGINWVVVPAARCDRLEGLVRS